MKISIRDFQLKANEYLEKAPLELTRYGRVVAKVEMVEDYDGVIKPKVEGERCQACKRWAVGRGKVWNEEVGEDVEVSLCEIHLKGAQKVA